MTQTDTLAASHSLRRLKALDLLSARGIGSKTFYVAGQALNKAATQDTAAFQPNLEGMSDNLEGMHRISVNDLPVQLRKTVQTIALGARVQPDQAKKIIVELCRWRPLSSTEIASLLGRSTKHVTDAYLYPMIKEGMLKYVHPDMVNHPQQKYEAI